MFPRPRLVLKLIAAAAFAALLGSAAVADTATTPAAPAAPAPAKAVPPRITSVIHSDPAIRRGVLPNGLRYAILRNTTPAGAVAVRLGLDVGAFDEAPSEYGAAHFLEHMAFSAGKNEHVAGRERAFAAEGVAFGRDVNAFTRLFDTQYALDLPHADEASLDLAFSWMRDVADGSTFAKEAMDREREIVLAERQERLSPEQAASQATERFQAPGLRSTSHDIIGAVESLRAMSGDRLRAFYDRWYRPERAVLVIVGDVDVDAVQKRIERTFSSWTGKGPAPARAALGAPDERRGPDAFVQSEPHLLTGLSACRVHAPAPKGPDDIVRMRREVLTGTWQRIVNARLARLTKSDHPPFLAAQVMSSDDLREAEAACLVVVPIDDAWKSGFQAAKAVLSEFQARGPTQDEIDEAVVAGRARFRGELRSAGTRGSPALASVLVGHELTDEVTPTPVEAFRAYDYAVEDMDPKAVMEAFRRDWSGGGPLLSAVAPQAPSAAALLSAWNEAGPALAEAQPAEGPPPAWAYASFGRAGRVVKREAFHDPDFIRLTFANGAILNFKQTAFEQKAVDVRVRFGAGRRELADDQYFEAEIGASLLKEAGLGRHDFQDLQRIFAQETWDASMAVGNDAFVLSGSTTTSGLEPQLQILAAYLTDPGFRRSMDARLPTTINGMYRMYQANPKMVMSQAQAEALKPGGPLSLPPRARLAAVRMRDLEALLKPAMTEDPLEVTIVGDVEESRAVDLVAKTFGALPPRKGTPRQNPGATFMRFPDGPLPVARATHDGPRDQAVVGMIWPLYVAVPERRREEVALLLLGRVFDDELRHTVRQEMGKSYSPNVDTDTPDKADQGLLSATVETSPADAEAVAAAIRATAARLARGEFTDEALEAARRPMDAGLHTRAATNDWWAGSLDGSARSDVGIRDMMTLEGLAASVTALEVRKAAAVWLARDPMVVIVTPQPAASAQASPPPAAPLGGGR